MLKQYLTSLLLLFSLLASAQTQQQALPAPQKSAISPQSKPKEEDQDVIRITTNLVQVDAVVTKDGKQVTDLKPEDFEIFEDGRTQTITNFSYVSNVSGTSSSSNGPAKSSSRDVATAPLVAPGPRPHEMRRTIAMVVDDLGMSFESMSQVRRQARKFIDQKLQPNDLVAIIRTGGEVGALQQFTTDKRMLYNAIEHLRWNPCSRTGLSIFAPAGSESAPADAPCGGQRNLTGTLRVLKFIVQGMRDLPGRKSLVLFSDHLPVEQQEPGSLNSQQNQNDSTSVDTGDADFDVNTTSYLAQLQRVAELAIRASVVIYAVDTRGLPYTGLTAADRLTPGTGPRGINNQIQTIISNRSRAIFIGREGSDLIAKETGGFLVRNSNDFGLERIADDQKGYYLLGYRPTDETFNRKFHHIKVSVKRRGLSVRTREGFYGISEEDAQPKELTAGDQLKKALASPFGANDIALRLTTVFTNFADAGSHLRSLVYIEAHDLSFIDEPDGGHKATFDLGIILFGDNGRIREQQSRTVTLRLHAGDYEGAVRNGIVYTLDTPLKQSGAFQFRIALRDQRSERIGSAGQFVQIPNLQNGRLALSGLVLLERSQDKPNSPSTSVPSSGPPQQKPQDDDIRSGPAVRQFRQGSKVLLVYSIYNAQLDQATHHPQLTALMRIFRDGKPVFTGNPIPIDATAQADLMRIPNVAGLQLGSEFPPGDYVLQVVVTDHLAKEKQQTASQWIDFEVVK